MNLNRLRTDERGLTLSELMVAIFLLTIVSIVFSSVLSSSLRATRDIENSARTNDDIRLILERVDKELRGAETVCSPAPGDSSNTLSFITRTNPIPPADTRHVIYRLVDVDGDGASTDFQRSGDGGLTYVTINATVANEAVAIDLGTPQFLFENQGRNEINNTGLPAASPSYGKVVRVSVWIDRSPLDRITPRLESTEVAGRNIWTPNAANC